MKINELGSYLFYNTKYRIGFELVEVNGNQLSAVSNQEKYVLVFLIPDT